MFCFKIDTFYFAPQFQWIFDFVARLFTVINSSINFFIYSISGSDFRNGIGSCMGSSEPSQSTQQSTSLQRMSCSDPRRMSVSRFSPLKRGSVRPLHISSECIHTSIASLCTQIRNWEAKRESNATIDTHIDESLKSQTYLDTCQYNPNWV